MMIAVREMARTMFESADYEARGHNNHEYVNDLYRAYLMRVPDGPGWEFWEGQCNAYGREQVRRAFDECGEFAGKVAAINPNGSVSGSVSSLLSARVDPNNQPGDQLLARDAEWGVTLLSLPGRAGLDLGLGLSYSSAAVWTRSGPYSYFDEDNGTPSPGFRLGFPTVQEVFFDAQVGVNARVLITPAGHRVELRQVGTSNVYEAADSSYLQLVDYGGSLLVRSTDGVQMSYTKLQDEWRCTQIEDRNGNYLTINNYWWGDIANITDTLGREITFNYDSNANLISITQTWNGQTHTWATFGWGNIPMQPNLPGVIGTHSGDVIPMLNQVALDDGSLYTFEYNANGQINLIHRYTTPDNVQRSYIGYNYAPSADGSPRLTGQRVWAENWTGINGVPNEVVTHFGLEGDKHTMTVEGDPNGTVYKESYGTGWQRGLTTGTEVWAGGSLQKTTTTSWVKDDNTPNGFPTNPRVSQNDISDPGGNHRRTTIDYGPYAQYGLPYIVTESGAINGSMTELRRSYTDYQLTQPYLDRRIIGLVSTARTYDPSTSQWQSKVTYDYDANIQSQAVTAIQHDQSFDDSILVRGNVTSVSRWDANDINNAGKALTTQVGYNAAGSVLNTSDPLGHGTTVTYTDQFAANGTTLDASRPATWAYPTSVSDADGYTSRIRYNYEFGAVTWKQTPQPSTIDNLPGPEQTFSYDSAARIQRVTNLVNNAYTRYDYGPYYTQSFSSVNNVADDAYAVQLFDGAGHVFASAGYHPGSSGGYSAVYSAYDAMGRRVKQSNPTEMNGNWLPVGDDSGWVFTQQTYDWKGRPLETTNQEGHLKYASYSACGCAGSEVTTLTDEMGRQQKVYSDVLGRTAKTETLNWDSTVYATTVNTYNGRDQVMAVRQYQGGDTSGVYQDTTMSYDGYGRLHTKHVPEQEANTATTWDYNIDDTVHAMTDARGASVTYGYTGTNRRLVTGITYNTPSGVAPTSNVSFAYDAAGNRTSMTDGAGSMTYQYNQLSQLTSETRQFSGSGAPSGNYAISYQYDLGGELKKITDPSNVTINYNYDSAGRIVGVTGEDTLMENVSSYASNLAYRAWGGLRDMDYGNGTHWHTDYDQRLLPTSTALSNVYPGATMTWNYDYYSDASIKHAYDVADNRFDRLQEYDQAGRLKEAYTGREARGESPTTPFSDDPYRQSSNMTSGTM